MSFFFASKLPLGSQRVHRYAVPLYLEALQILMPPALSLQAQGRVPSIAERCRGVLPTTCDVFHRLWLISTCRSANYEQPL